MFTSTRGSAGRCTASKPGISEDPVRYFGEWGEYLAK